jgi:hypothetical protein
MKDMAPYLGGLLDTPLYKGGVERKGKEKPVARLLTNAVLIRKLRSKREEEARKAATKAAKAAAKADKAAGKAKPKAKGGRKAKPKDKAQSTAVPKSKPKTASRKRSRKDAHLDSGSDIDHELGELLGLNKQASASSNNAEDPASAESKRATKSRRVTEGKADAPSAPGAATGTSEDCCVNCRNPPSADQALYCAGCARVWHAKCALSATEYRARLKLLLESWLCRTCRQKVVVSGEEEDLDG